MSRITIPCSNVAALIGMNPYQPVSKIFEKLWEKYSENTFRAAFEKAGQDSAKKHFSRALETLPDHLRLLQACETHASSAESIKDIDGNVSKVRTAVEAAMKDRMNEVEHLRATNADETRVQSAEQAVKKFKDSAQIIVKEAESRARTGFGTAKENAAIAQYRDEYDVDVRCDAALKFLTIRPGLSLCGKLDGMIADRCILEVKNRTKRLFADIPEYEKVQVEAYMRLFDKEECVLLQSLKHSAADRFELKPSKIKRDDVFWQVIVDRLCAIISYLEDLKSDEEIAAEYCGGNEIDREGLLGKIIHKIYENKRN